MPRILQLKRGNAEENNSYTGAEGEPVYDSTNKTLRVHDGATAGGSRLAKRSEVESAASASMPNYSKGIGIASPGGLGNNGVVNTIYTAPANGYIAITQLSFNVSAHRVIIVGGNQYYSCNEITCVQAAALPINAGETFAIKLLGASSTALPTGWEVRFIPCKGL